MVERERFMLPVAVFILFFRGDEVLLIRRKNTGYMDGSYSVPAGWLEAEDTLESGAKREALEEVGVSIASLSLGHMMHCKISGKDWLGAYFIANTWEGEPVVNEPHKHDEVRWCSIDFLPVNLLWYVRQAILHIKKGITYSDYE